MLIKILKKIVKEKREEDYPDSLIINFLKEYLQFPVLDFIYNNKKFDHFIFTGGSCLRICYDLPRLSEDIDFDLTKENFEKLNLEELGEDLKKHFKDQFLFDINYKAQGGKRLYLKFNLLEKLNLSYGEGSNILYVKIEPQLTPFKEFNQEPIPVSKYNYNFVTRTYSLEFLMAGKILAILERDWFKGKNNEIDIKGRDFYDLYWYLNRGVEPNMRALKNNLGIKSEKELKRKLWNKIEQDVTKKKLLYDLENFFSNQKYITDFCKNYKKIIKKNLSELGS